MGLDNRTWLKRNLDATSQLWNVRYLNGDPNESISGRSFRQGVLEGSKKWNRLRRVIDRFFWAFARESEHCRQAWMRDNGWAGRRLYSLNHPKKRR